jgi:hypothetical protein
MTRCRCTATSAQSNPAARNSRGIESPRLPEAWRLCIISRAEVCRRDADTTNLRRRVGFHIVIQMDSIIDDSTRPNSRSL